MCLIMTTAAAAVFGGIWIYFTKCGRATRSLFTAMLMFASAALMWCVDGIASVAGGEGFFDISGEDAILGVIIIALGLAAFGVLSMIERGKAGHNRPDTASE